ncbi:MAG: hypothetical protein O3C27_10080 [Actinomycetota bacterium]|nr:hypothetical protein [Actinomycetota bacterium]
MAVDLYFDRPSRSHRVRRSFGFVDLSGFTAFSATNGDDRAVEQLSLFRAVLRSVGSATGVRVAKWLGDGAMLVALEPATLVSAILRVKRMLAAEGSELPIHAGVAAGDVILFEGDDHIGNVVNLAARLAARAAPGQILAPADTFHGLSRSDALLGPIQIPGFEHPIEVADLALAPALVESYNL